MQVDFRFDFGHKSLSGAVKVGQGPGSMEVGKYTRDEVRMGNIIITQASKQSAGDFWIYYIS
jgi:hypothetical protein